MFEIELFICIKMDLALNYLQMLICHKTQINKQIDKTCIYFIYCEKTSGNPSVKNSQEVK